MEGDYKSTKDGVQDIRQSTSAGHPQLTTGIPVGKPVGMKLADPSFW
jgi:hypothetical protein